MGCSRQNIKRLALALGKKGFVRLLLGVNNSVLIELTDKVDQYDKESEKKKNVYCNRYFACYSWCINDMVEHFLFTC